MYISFIRGVNIKYSFKKNRYFYLLIFNVYLKGGDRMADGFEKALIQELRQMNRKLGELIVSLKKTGIGG